MSHQFPMNRRGATAVLVVASLLLAVSAPAQNYAQRLASFQAKHGIPGMSCAIAVQDELVFAQGVGVADLENDVPATADTVYRLASISKPITAVLAMQLVEQGLLDLDADVHTIVKQWPAKRWPVTTRQLLGHLAGVRHYKAGEGECHQHFSSQTAGLIRFADDPLLHEPGTKYQYSTFGFNLVAAVVEQKAAADFATLVRQRIAEPCGAASLQDDDVRRIIAHRARGYVKRAGKLQNSQLMDASYKLGGGGLCASAPDLVRFAQALLAGKLVTAKTFASMSTEQQKNDGKSTGYGLGFGVAKHDGVQIVQHSGAQSQVSTMLLMLPESRVAVAVLCNLEGQKLGALAREFAFAAKQANYNRSDK
jgi:CubicO group peptidase (beta-lactamase class C family)